MGLVSDGGVQASLYYTIVYSFTALASFGVITHITSNSAGIENISDIAGLSKNHPYYAILILFTMLSSAGIPPFIGFHAKLIVQTLVNQSLVFLSVIVVLMTVISAYYYLKVIKSIYFEEQSKPDCNIFKK